MNFKTISLVTFLTAISCSTYAAVEFTPEQARSVKPYTEITVRKAFNNIGDATKAVSKVADKAGAYGFYINNIGYHSTNDSMWIVTAFLYQENAAEVDAAELRQFHGVYEYPKDVAIALEPYEQIMLRGAYSTQNDANNAAGKEALKLGAYAFYIDEQYQIGGSNNQQLVIYIFKEDAPKRTIQPPQGDIPYDSEAGQAALAAGGELAEQVEKPDRYSSSEFGKKSSRYTVTLPDKTKIQELNNSTAAKMQSFDQIVVKGYYTSLTQISHAVAKKAADKGAKYYHIARMIDKRGNNNYIIYVNLYR